MLSADDVGPKIAENVTYGAWVKIDSTEVGD